MLEPPGIPEQLILAGLQDEYGLGGRLQFLPLGADVHTAVFRLDEPGGAAYFVKLRTGNFEETSLTLPRFLHQAGLEVVIPPLPARSGGLWAPLGEYFLIVYPFVEGRNGYEVALTPRQWGQFGAAMRFVHAARAPQEIARRIPVETFPSSWRAEVGDFLRLAQGGGFADPHAAAAAEFLRQRQEQVRGMLERTEQLAQRLRARPPQFVLCHSDMHAGNLLLGTGEALHIVDWDNPSFSPRERDLLFIGGCPVWASPHMEQLFYEGYGPADLDERALAYYRYEWIIKDIAWFCRMLLLSSAGGADRPESLRLLRGEFAPGAEVEIALAKDRGGD